MELILVGIVRDRRRQRILYQREKPDIRVMGNILGEVRKSCLGGRERFLKGGRDSGRVSRKRSFLYSLVRIYISRHHWLGKNKDPKLLPAEHKQRFSAAPLVLMAPTLPVC